LLRVAQAPFPCFFGGSSGAHASLVLLSASLALSACGSGGFGMRQAEIDMTVLTGDIQAPGSDAGRTSDEATVRNAVSSADVELLSGEPLRWANPETGARGSITGLTESTRAGRLCRDFVTTHENYDGVRLFRGEACMLSAGAWLMQAFQPL
jgi:surface antigen